MQIGGKDYSEILVTDEDGGLLASITDEDVVEEKNCKVVCVCRLKINRGCCYGNYLDWKPELGYR